MKYFAQVENDIVQQVIKVSDENAPNESSGQEFISSIGLSGTWIQTCKNRSMRSCFAGKGYRYHSATDKFVAPCPYESWTWNDTTGEYDPPTPKPDDGKEYRWNENTISWDEIT